MAMIASMALPPSARIARPASAARTCGAATAQREKAGVSVISGSIGILTKSVHMFHRQIGESVNPLMPSSLPDCDIRRRKCRIGEGSDGDRDQTWKGRRLPTDRRAAHRTEPKRHEVAPVRHPSEFTGIARDGHLLSQEPCLDAEDAAGPTLAFKTMAQGYPAGLALAKDFQAPAIAGGAMGRHGASLVRAEVTVLVRIHVRPGADSSATFSLIAWRAFCAR